MWTKNGEPYLPRVLKRIEEVIPAEAVHRKILVDDSSTDRTVEIAKEFNWEVYLNPEGGIPSGANEALRHVDCSYFISFEQDLVLSKDWWLNVQLLLEKNRVVVASGVRLPDRPLALKKLQEFVTEVYRTKTMKNTSFFYGKTLDNTIYQTEVVRRMGGFPKLRVNGGVDNVLAKTVHDCGYVWKVNYDVISTHLRKGLDRRVKTLPLVWNLPQRA
jgi:glycosyltransferase involved in cell wall biosynthesis